MAGIHNCKEEDLFCLPVEASVHCLMSLRQGGMAEGHGRGEPAYSIAEGRRVREREEREIDLSRQCTEDLFPLIRLHLRKSHFTID